MKMQPNDKNEAEYEFDEVELQNSIYAGALPDETATPDSAIPQDAPSGDLHPSLRSASPLQDGSAPSVTSPAPAEDDDLAMPSMSGDAAPSEPKAPGTDMVYAGPAMPERKKKNENVGSGMEIALYGAAQKKQDASKSTDLIITEYEMEYIDQNAGSSSKEVAIFKSGVQVRSENGTSVAVGSGIAQKPRIGEKLVAKGIITESQLQIALSEKKLSGKLLGETLVDLGFVTETVLAKFLAEDAGFELLDPNLTIIDSQALAMLSQEEAKELKMLPVAFASQNEILVAVTDPYDVIGMDRLRQRLPRNLEIKPLVTTASYIMDAIEAAYGYSNDIEGIIQNLDEGKHETDLSKLNDSEQFKHPIVRLVNALLLNAVKMGVSDLHFEPEETFVRLRNRLDGVLYTAQIIHKKHWAAMAQRIKIMCDMNIADKFSPQDGRIGMNVNGRHADFRVSVLPTVNGENIVMRVLDKSASILPLEALGFSEHNLNLIHKAQARPEGIIIVTGPTGSGKSTSLYSMLNAINTVDINIQTLEDPVEYSVPMIRQTAIKEGFLDFADGIKALLRQDPDIIFIGEIRDHVTAEMALKAAMTGHQVYTTLHTNDSFGAIPRLLDLGMKPGMISGSIVAIFAQRLARRLCKSCKEEHVATAEECKWLRIPEGDPAPTICHAHEGGCNACNGTGYKGRIGIVEILTFDEEMDDILARGADKVELKDAARRKGFKSMREDGILKVIQGTTSLEEIMGTVDLSKE